MRTRPKNRRAGFTLIEILVAFVILGMAGGVLLSVFGNSTAKAMRAENERLAVLYARSLLGRVGNDMPLATGMQKGKSQDGQEWSISIQSYGQTLDASDDTPKPVTQPYLVTVHTTYGTGASQAAIDLTSVRLAWGGS